MTGLVIVWLLIGSYVLYNMYEIASELHKLKADYQTKQNEIHVLKKRIKELEDSKE